MHCSNRETCTSIAFTEKELAEIKDKIGVVDKWGLKQTAPMEFLLEPNEVGNQFTAYGSSGNAALVQVGNPVRPKLLQRRTWGMALVKEAHILKSGVKFTPDTTRDLIRRNVERAAQAKATTRSAREQAARDDNSLMSLREFTEAVEKVNRFVVENEGHVVLEIRGGLIKFLAEG